MRTGIVLEGGAMRGMFTAGILDVFMKEGIHFDGAVGVSAGATFGCNLKSEQQGRTLRYNKKYCGDKRYASIESLIKTGDIFNAKFDYDDIPNRLDPYDTETFMKNPMDFWVVATNVDTGEPVYHKMIRGDGREIDWLRASASMPGLSNVVYCSGDYITGRGPEMPVPEGEEKYIHVISGNVSLSDGGTSDSVPLKFFEDLGYDRIVVICTQPDNYVKKKNSLLPVLTILLKSYPELIAALERRHIMYNATMEYISKRACEDPEKVMVIRPQKALNVKRVVHDPDEIQRVYDIGYAEGIRRLEAVKKFLGE